MIGYLAFCFAVQGAMDLMRWRSALALALVDVKDRITWHRERQDDPRARAENILDRFRDRVAEHRRVVDPLQAELEALMASGADPGRRGELFELLEAEHGRMAAFNAANPQVEPDSGDLEAIEAAAGRVGWLRRFLAWGRWLSLVVPLAIATVAASVLISTLVRR